MNLGFIGGTPQRAIGGIGLLDIDPEKKPDYPPLLR
ncbi:Uncharacterised protein [Candidatus Venteria ishoeyi]|uniref:Uncharacterized protein n=1 Tax=Candidatus Venteria ishoeyi TaxID=1899563 RepID=A0A1H6F6J4_9GAMM|nr:Uncharacterised protein [Candidatus Venteria ishoeyi]